MNKTPSFRQQFDKLTAAYIENKVNPFEDCACFVGNLLNGNGSWADERMWESADILEGLCTTHFFDTEIINNVLSIECNAFYSPDEIIALERKFLQTFVEKGGKRNWKSKNNWSGEDALFMAFECTLDLLKQIHQSKGEVIDETPPFVKRNLNPKPLNELV